MAVGIGIDAVDVAEAARLLGDGTGAFAERAFTCAERAEALARGGGTARGAGRDVFADRRAAAHLAGKFAAKEAVLKALCCCGAPAFDLRVVEVLEDGRGRPRVTLEGPLAPVLAEAGVTEVLVSIARGRDLAVATALAR